MSNEATMHPKDAIFGGLAKCFATINGRRYHFMTMTDFEAKWDVKLVEVKILGKVGMGHKPAGGKGTWKGTAHYNQSYFRAMANEYQKTGFMPYFEMQITNEDKGASIGRQTIILYDCLCESFTLAKFQSGEGILDEDLSGTFESFDMPEMFADLPGV